LADPVAILALRFTYCHQKVLKSAKKCHAETAYNGWPTFAMISVKNSHLINKFYKYKDCHSSNPIHITLFI
jgi:hypothetical protein